MTDDSDLASGGSAPAVAEPVVVLLVGHHQHPEARELVRDAAAWLADRGARAVMERDEAEAMGAARLGTADAAQQATACLSLGGDGTMLRAVHTVAESGIPIIGVNLGHLGYLTEIEPAGWQDALARWLAGPVAGRWRIEERMMLDVCSGAGAPVRRALNEAVLERSEPGHTVHVLVHIDGSAFTSYAVDGMIVATPTGSTAYSLSVRGPVVSPQHRALLVTPVAPHMLFDRSMVLDPDEAVTLEMIGHRPGVLTIDGQYAGELAAGESVRVSASTTTARFVRFGERRFHQVLKAKFGLADR